MGFKFGCVFVMILSAFSSYDKSPIVIMLVCKRTTTNFVDIENQEALIGFYFSHDHLNDIVIVKDGAPLHYNCLSNRWKEAHGMTK